MSDSGSASARATPRITGRELLRADGQVCLDRFARRAGPLLTRAALRIVQDPETADEIVQDLYLALLNGRHVMPAEPDHVVPWSLRTVRHRALDRLRRQSVRHRTHALLRNTHQCHPGDLPAPDAGIGGLPIHHRIRGAIGALRSEEQAVISRRFYLEETQQEVGLALGIPLGTVKTRERLALAKLRRCLAVSGPAREVGDIDRPGRSRHRIRCIERVGGIADTNVGAGVGSDAGTDRTALPLESAAG